MKTGLLLTTPLLLILSSFMARGETLHVPGQHATIQAAVDKAKEGDTILVKAGTYRERITLKPDIVVRSEGDDSAGQTGLARAEATIIDGSGGEGAGVEMAKGATLDGFTVTGVGKYDDKVWQHDHETQGNEQMHGDIGQPGVAGIAVRTEATVIHNIVHHNGYTGIAITGKVSPLIAKNTCFRNMGGGIGSMEGTTARIEENTCYENLYAGIGCSQSSPSIKGNTCHHNIRAGIGVSEGSSPLVEGNECFANRRAGIGIRTGEDTRPVVRDNDCRQNEMAGIGVEERARPVLEKNRITNNKLVAIGVVGGSQAMIHGNELSREGGFPPMIAVLDGSEAVITGNTIRGGGVTAILVKGKAEVRDNRFTGNGPSARPPAAQAVWAHPGSEVICTGNHVQGWKTDINATGDAKTTSENNTVEEFR